MNSNIVVVGSLNMDIVISAGRMPKLGETILGESVTYLPGGKGANQAVGAAKLGSSVKLAGAVGQDAFGKSILEQLKKVKVDTELVRTVPGTSTGVANIFHVENDNCITVIPGANYSYTPELAAEQLDSIFHEAGVLVVQLEIPLETVQFMLSEAKKRGIKTILNPAPARHLSPQLLAGVDYLTPNETELATILGHEIGSEEELEMSMAKWQETYGNTLVVTMGEKGCAYLENGKIKMIPPCKVNVVDTTGAGDAFNAALAYSVSLGLPLDTGVSFAVKVSSLSVTKFGAQEGMPYLHEMTEN